MHKKLYSEKLVFGLALLWILSGCTEIPATNPFDPDAPETLHSRAILSGTITSALSDENQPPVTGARVTISGPTTPEPNVVVTDETGTFRFVDLLPGIYEVAVDHPGHLPRDRVFNLDFGEEAAVTISLRTIDSDGVTDVTGQLSGVARKGGRPGAIEDQDHSGIVVEVDGAGLRTVTNRSGQFDLFLRPGVYTLNFDAADYNRKTLPDVGVVPAQQTTLETVVVLDPNPGSIHGTASLERAVAMGPPGITVSILGTDGTDQVAPDGTYGIEVPAGTYSVQFEADDHDAAFVHGVAVLAGQPTELDAVVLPLSRGAIEGRVTLAGRGSHEGALVQLLGTPFGASTTVEGRFRIDGAPVGDYELQVCKQGFESVSTLVSVFANETLTLEMGGGLELPRQQVVVHGDGSVLTRARFSLRADVPAWITEVQITGDLAPQESQGFRPYDGSVIDLDLNAGDGAKRLAVQFRGAGCNASEVFVIEVDVDSDAPTLDAVSIVRGRESIPDGPKYTNEPTIVVELQGLAGAHDGQLHYSLVGGVQVGRPCPAAEDLTETAAIATSLVLVPVGNERKKVCVAVSDAAGNFSDVLADTVTIDRVAPGGPTLSPSHLNGVNRSCVNLTPSGDLDDNLWKFEYRQVGEIWTDSVTDSGDAISIDLYQDSDNLIEVRAVDKAGNRGAGNQAFIEEVSSLFIPTDLQIKQICNGGQYAILKDMSVTHTVVRDENVAWGLSKFVQMPEIALLNLEDFTIQSLSPPIDADGLGGCQDLNNAEFIHSSIIDAACSGEAGEPALMLVSPSSADGACYAPPLGSDLISAFAGRLELIVWPDPMENPVSRRIVDFGQVLERLNDDSIALVSIDALDWTGAQGLEAEGYDFNALIVDAQSSDTCSGQCRACQNACDTRHGQSVIECRRNAACIDRATATHTSCHAGCAGTTYAYNIRRLSGNARRNGTHGLSILASQGTATHAPDDDTTPNQYRMRGLAMWGNNGAVYMKYDAAPNPDRWVGYASTAPGNAGLPFSRFTTRETDEFNSPYGSRVTRAHFAHGAGEAFEKLIYAEDIGRALLRRSTEAMPENAEGTEWSWRYVVVGQQAPVAGARASFFEVGNNQVNWVDANDSHIIYQNQNYGRNPTRYRHAVDTGRPIYPALGGGSAGEPFLIYHTASFSQGVVIGYKDEADCAE